MWTCSNGVSGPAEKSFKFSICYKAANANLWTSQNIRRNKTTEIWYLVTPRRSSPISTVIAYTYHYSHNVIIAHFALLQMGAMSEASTPDSLLTFIMLATNVRSLGLPQA